MNHTRSEEEDDDDIPRLSADTLAALLSFRTEQEARLREEDEKQQAQALSEPDNFEEDWNLSQFWYDDATADLLAKEALAQCDGGPIACLCTPSVFRGLKRVAPPSALYSLFEYDRRFRCYGDRFVFYDLHHPENLSVDLHGKFTYLFFDPPFLSEACVTEAAKAIRLLGAPNFKLVILTGIVLEPILKRLFSDLRTCVYKPRHKRNLQNDFFTCANYTSSLLGVKD